MAYCRLVMALEWQLNACTTTNWLGLGSKVCSIKADISQVWTLPALSAVNMSCCGTQSSRLPTASALACDGGVQSCKSVTIIRNLRRAATYHSRPSIHVPHVHLHVTSRRQDEAVSVLAGYKLQRFDASSRVRNCRYFRPHEPGMLRTESQ